MLAAKFYKNPQRNQKDNGANQGGVKEEVFIDHMTLSPIDDYRVHLAGGRGRWQAIRGRRATLVRAEVHGPSGMV
jgi:hypothetical protein